MNPSPVAPVAAPRGRRCHNVVDVAPPPPPARSRAPAARFGILGPIEVAVAGIVRPPGGPKQRLLLAVLLLEAPRPVSVDRLLDELWGETPPASGRSALQVLVSALRGSLPVRLRTLPGAYALDAAGDELDAARFAAMAAEGRALRMTDPARASAVLGEALSLWRGDALAGVPPTPSVTAAAARLEEARLAAIEDRAEADLALGRHEELVAELRALVRQQPTRERLVGLLMLAMHRGGDSAGALRVYEEVGGVLDRELGVDPGDDLVELHKAIRRGDPTLVPADRASLPVPGGRFVGRRAELDEAARLLLGSRLLTFVGPGGCGKSRLALEVARACAAAHPGGVHLVELAAASGDDRVVHHVAGVLGVRERADASIERVLVEHLRHRRALLLLDDCEHVAGGAARLVARLTEHCPGMRVLATSRQRLGVPGEVAWTVPALALPPAGAAAAEIAASDAFQLLADRAAGAGRPIGAGPADLDDAARICRRLDGLPLALELAAARLRGFSLAELARLVERSLDVLGGAAPGAEPRHQTLRAAIDWSHRLLDDPERAALRRLSVLRGGGALDAALAVCADRGGPAPRTPAEAAGPLGVLVDRSLVAAVGGPRGTRYRLLEVVREHAAERLAEAGEEAAARRRHAAWYADQAAEAANELGREYRAWLERLGADNDNLRAALAWWADADPEAAMGMAASLWRYWYARGAMSEGAGWLRRALAAGRQEPSRVRARALQAAAALARVAGAVEEAVTLSESAYGAARDLGDEAAYPACLNGLGVAALMAGDSQAALRHGLESVAWAERTGNRRGTAVSTHNVANVLRALGRFEEAEARYRLAVDVLRELGDRIAEATAINNIGRTMLLRGRVDDAAVACAEALAIHRELGWTDGMLDAMDALAGVEVRRGRPGPALRLLAATERERRRTGFSPQVPQDLQSRARDMAAARAALGGESDAAAAPPDRRPADLDDLVDELLAAARPR